MEEQVQEQTPEEKAPRKPGEDLFYWLGALVGAIVVLTLVFSFLGRLTRVDGHSMDPTLAHNEMMLVWSLGGDTVDIDYENSVVYLNGQPLDEPYLGEPMSWPGSPYMQRTHFEIPEGSVFVMGDNRNNSTDSRDDQLGTIDTGYVLGKAVLALWTMDRFGTV